MGSNWGCGSHGRRIIQTQAPNKKSRRNLIAHAGQDGIFDWELLQGTTANTIDDLFAITVLKGDKGDRIGRNSKSVLDESQLVYLTDSKKIIRPPNVWIWFGGAIKVHADLRGENISLADKKYYLSVDSDGYSTHTNKQTTKQINTTHTHT